MTTESFEKLKLVFDEAHRRTLTNFGIPERFIDGDDVKIWNFRVVVIPHVQRTERFSWPDLVPVFSGEKQIGGARIVPVGDNLVAIASVDYSCPERLDWENGQDYSVVVRKAQGTDASTCRIGSLELVPAEDDVFVIDQLDEEWQPA